MTDEELDEHLKRTDRKIKSVFVFPNRNVAVCDQFGQQMPEFQGTYSEELMRKIREAAGPDVEWNGV